MASSYRKIYTYINKNGETCKTRICGRTQEETDLLFQKLCQADLSGSTIGLQSRKLPMSFHDFVEKEYRNNYITCLAKSTQGKDNYYLSHYIYPFLGPVNLGDISVNTIIQFRNYLAAGNKSGFRKNLSEKSIEDMTGFLNKIFKVAVALGRIHDNPIKRELLHKVGEPSHHHKAIDPEVLDRCKAMIPQIKETTVRLYSALLFFNGGGMRPEEVLGLRWEDCDLDQGIANVRQAVTYVGSNRATDIKSTKTEMSNRPVIFPQVLVGILKPEKQDSGYILHGRCPEEPLCYSSWKRTYQKMQNLLGIRGQYTNYDLRTTFATQLIEAGQSALAVAQMMGHKDTRMVETVYARRRKEGFESRRQLIELLNKTTY